MSFTWAMTWLNLAKQYQGEQLEQQQTAFIENASTQFAYCLEALLTGNGKTGK